MALTGDMALTPWTCKSFFGKIKILNIEIRDINSNGVNTSKKATKKIFSHFGKD